VIVHVPTDGGSVPLSMGIFIPKAWGPTVLVKTEGKKVLRTSAFSALLVTNSPLLFNSGPIFSF